MGSKQSETWDASDLSCVEEPGPTTSGQDLQSSMGNSAVQDLLGPLSNPADCGYTVAGGDTLWGISQRLLGDGSHWTDLYGANQSVVGGNPNLIFPVQNLQLCDLDSDPESLVCEEPAVEGPLVCEDPGGATQAPIPTSGDLTMEQYLKLVGVAEARYKEKTEANGGTASSTDFVAGMRSRYGYEGGLWEKMIPDAPAGPDLNFEDYPELKSLFELDEKGNPTDVARKVKLDNGDLLDPGHLYTGIDATLHPDADAAIDTYGINSQDASTWSGDVGQALVRHQETGGNKTVEESWNDNASTADLNADLDGVILGNTFDSTKGLTDQLRSYYLDPKADTTYTKRYSTFCDQRGLGVQDGALDDNGKGIVRSEVDDFAEAYGRRNGAWYNKLGGTVLSKYDEDAQESTQMTDRFVDYVNNGLKSETK